MEESDGGYNLLAIFHSKMEESDGGYNLLAIFRRLLGGIIPFRHPIRVRLARCVDGNGNRQIQDGE